ncbi:uncharacterized protein LOC121989953 [Zingiber officinale]|uniref:uncharacterized protein LOC121989953 n=1 Tax=Zingiber officinale TaxID=94328 RepID=UPI001C4DAB83|nr:uncharacterized protein LOC121989953 [Zingiber officinale]
MTAFHLSRPLSIVSASNNRLIVGEGRGRGARAALSSVFPLLSLMAYDPRRGYSSSALVEGFTLSPLPYPVLLVLLMVLLLLGLSWFFDYETFVEEAEEQMSWLLLLLPVLLVFLIRWVSSMESLDEAFYGAFFPGHHRRRGYYDYGGQSDEGGGSPWTIALVVVLLLVMVYFQSSFQEMWGP